MNYLNLLNLIIIGITGIVLGTYLGRRRGMAKKEEKKELLVAKQAREKEENKRQIMEFFDGALDGKAANDDIEKLLGVSDVHPAN